MWWDLLQESQIWRAQSDAVDARMAANTAEATSRELRRDVQRLQRQVDQLRLALLAVTELTQENLGITDVQILERATEIDLRDGQLDGRVSVPPATCPQCRHTNNGQRAECLYCGTPLSR